MSAQDIGILCGFIWARGEIPKAVREAMDRLLLPVGNIHPLNTFDESDQKKPEIEHVDKVKYDTIIPKITPYINVSDDGKLSLISPKSKSATDTHVVDKNIIEAKDPDQEQNIPDRDESIENNPETPEITPSGKKERKPWSDEARAAARDRAIDRGLGKGNKRGNTIGATLPPPMPVSRPAAPPARSEGALTDSDWPDVKRMRERGMSDHRIASNYEIEQDELLVFCARQLDREKANQGNG